MTKQNSRHKSYGQKNDAARRRAEKRARDNEDQWLFGIHAVLAVLEKNPQRLIELVLEQDTQNDRLQELVDLATQHGLPVHRWTSAAMLKRLDQRDRHQGVLARCRPLPVRRDKELEVFVESAEQQALYLLLDEVTDPHNLGACLRSADAYGVDAIIVPEDKSARLNAVVHKIAVGAAETVPVFRVSKINKAIRLLKRHDVSVVGTAISDDAASLKAAALEKPLAIVMGSEGSGLRISTQELCDQLIYIPMKGYVDSLNVSVATGVMLNTVCDR